MLLNIIQKPVQSKTQFKPTTTNISSSLFYRNWEANSLAAQTSGQLCRN